MDTLYRFDTLEQLIYNENIRIQAIDVHSEIDMLLIVLNTGAVLKEKLSNYPTLHNGDQNALMTYELTGNGTGLHWPLLDEDISLKGLLRDMLKNQLIGNVA